MPAVPCTIARYCTPAAPLGKDERPKTAIGRDCSNCESHVQPLNVTLCVAVVTRTICMRQ